MVFIFLAYFTLYNFLKPHVLYLASSSRQARFPRQECWRGLSFPPPRSLPDNGSSPYLLHLLHWQADSLPLSHLGSPNECFTWVAKA